jgi:hypothetical protein
LLPISTVPFNQRLLNKLSNPATKYKYPFKLTSSSKFTIDKKDTTQKRFSTSLIAK